MRICRSFLAVGVIVVTTLGTGVIHGRLTHRWGHTEQVGAAGRELEAMPVEFAPGSRWQLQSESRIDDAASRILDCAGQLARTYVDRASGEVVNVVVVVGPTGPISAHTPDICLSSREYRPVGEREKTTLQDSQGREHEFWRSNFERNDVNKSRLRVYYAWSDGREWLAPGQPRFAFSGQPLLYKIQCSVAGLQESAKLDELGRRFLRDFIPGLASHLVRPSDN